MKKIALTLFAFCLLFQSPAMAQEDIKTKYDDGLTVVTLGHYTDDLHAAFMAFKIASKLEEKGEDVVIFLNLEAVRIADKQQPLDMAWGHNADFSSLYRAFLDNGGEILVCPHCAKSAGIDADTLRPDMVIAKEGQIVDLIAFADKVVSY